MMTSFVKFTINAMLLAVLIVHVSSQDYEDEKPIVRTRQARGPSLPRSLPRQNILSKSTTTTTEPPLEEEYADEEYAEEGIQEEPQTTTTEATKKPLRGVVRPFRSNDQLIEALKRRRAQASGNSIRGNTYQSVSSTTSTSTEQPKDTRARKPKSNNRFAPRTGARQAETTTSTTTEEPVSRGRLFAGRGGLGRI